MKVLLEEEWSADDIIEYCKKHNIECTVKSQEDINEMDEKTFLSYVFFCNTLIVQKNLVKSGLSHLIPDTYTSKFNTFFNRQIKKVTYHELQNLEYPIFIKPVENNKVFDGTVVKCYDEFKELWKFHQVESPEMIEYYVSEVVEFESEFRLFIGNGMVYG